MKSLCRNAPVDQGEKGEDQQQYSQSGSNTSAWALIAELREELEVTRKKESERATPIVASARLKHRASSPLAPQAVLDQLVTATSDQLSRQETHLLLLQEQLGEQQVVLHRLQQRVRDTTAQMHEVTSSKATTAVATRRGADDDSALAGSLAILEAQMRELKERQVKMQGDITDLAEQGERDKSAAGKLITLPPTQPSLMSLLTACFPFIESHTKSALSGDR